MLLDELDRAPLRNNIVLQAVRSGRAIPERLLLGIPPEVHVSQQAYMDCFWAVCSDRMQGSRVRYQAISAWCRDFGFSGSLLEDMHFVVNRLDMAYIEWASKKAKADSKRKNKT